MTLDDLGNLGEFLGAIAVVASLLYLSIQVRQNTRSVRSATAQSASETIVGMNSLIAGDRNVAELLATGAQGAKKLDPIDQLRFSLLVSSTFINFETMLVQNRLGLIEAEFWQSRERFFLNTILTLPGMLSWWRHNQEQFGEELRRYVNSHIQRPE